MANRRMISKLVISKTKFLKLPAKAQALYMHLTVNADDEGIAEAFAIIGMIRGKDEDLDVLAEAGFVQILDREESIVYITDWNDSNNIKGDRFTKSQYHDMLIQHQQGNADLPADVWQDNADLSADGLEGNADLPTDQPENSMEADWKQSGNILEADQKQSGNILETDWKQPGNILETDWKQPGNILEAQDRLGKDRLGKGRLGKGRLGNSAAARESTNSEYIGTSVDNSVDKLQQQPLATRLANDEPFAKVMALYQDNIHPVANQVEADDLISMFDDYGEEWLTQAIKEAARNNARSIKYIAAVLRSWEKKGDNPFRSRTLSDRAADVCRGALELLEASS